MSVDNFDVLFAKSLTKGGGGSGTDNYNELSNKPQINGNALTGNKTGANLGLQDAITSESKLSSDLIDDTGAENLFVSSTEKSTWGGKQDPATTLSGYGITDAYTKTETGTQITDAIGALDVSSVGGSGKYISAISETDGKISATAETMDTTPTSGSEKAVTSGAVYTALETKQPSLSQAQLAATNSGITAEKLAADEAALVEVVDGGAKSVLPIRFTTKTYKGIDITNNGDGTIKLDKSNTAGTAGIGVADLSSDASQTSGGRLQIAEGTYVVSCDFVGSDTGVQLQVYKTDGTTIVSIYNGNSPEEFVYNDSNTYPYIVARLSIGATASFNNVTMKPMICTKTEWAISHAFVPYCPSMQEMYQMILALQNGTRSAPALSTSAEPEEVRTEPETEPETGEEGEQR